MSGNSMSPTIEHSDRVLINKFSTVLFSPGAGDLIVLHPNGSPVAALDIKRIVGVPGDKILISEGSLFVNGSKVTDNFGPIEDPGAAKETIKLASGEFFVLSDNRNSMQDSRNVSYGTVKRSYMVGKAWFILSPVDRRGLLH